MEFLEVSFMDMLLSKAIYTPVLVAVVIAGIVSVVTYFCQTSSGEQSSSISTKMPYTAYFAVLVTFALLGAISGQMTGQSRDPAIGDVLPGILTLIGGLFMYLISKNDALLQLITASSITTLVLCLLIGTQWGAQLRLEYETNARLIAESGSTALKKEEVQHAVNLQKLLNKQQLLTFSEQLGIDPPK
ncbi:hypothetical protein [Magnetovibrio sp.]|uniref:hypothetical protein n=1 Tax=Magnetovibrio sp. TaxID=2024836 RepID=UPI002F92815B